MGKINGLFDDEMPREKLRKHGVKSLTDVELLAIILRVGIKNKNVIELSREILEKFDKRSISRKSPLELMKIKGVSFVKASQIVCVFELSRRLFATCNKPKIKLNNSGDVFNFIKYEFNGFTTEKVMLICVDAKNQVVGHEFIFDGSVDYSFLELRTLFKKVMNLDASGFFIIHNHPSGNCSPSSEDLQITSKIKMVADNLNIRFLDHIIVCDNEFYSLFDNSEM